MRCSIKLIIGALFVVLYLSSTYPKEYSRAAQAPDASREKKSSASKLIPLPKRDEKAPAEKGGREQKQVKAISRPLLIRQPLGFDISTIRKVREWLLTLPDQVTVAAKGLIKHSRLLGLAGSLTVLGFLVVLFSSIFGQRRLFQQLIKTADPLQKYIPELYTPYFLSLARILAGSIIPLALLGSFSLIRVFFPEGITWPSLTGTYLKLWCIGAVAINVSRELLTSDLYLIGRDNGTLVFRGLRILILYLIVSIGLLTGAEALHVPDNFIALLQFLISLSITFTLFFLMLRKKVTMGILPTMQYRSYRMVISFLERFYLPIIFLTFITGILWSFGYQTLCKVVWRKTWAVAAAYVGIIICYHIVRRFLSGWIEKNEADDETSMHLYRTMLTLLLYVTSAAILLATLYLLDMFDLLQQILSFSMVMVGETPLSLWIIVKAAFIIIAFYMLSRLLRAWLDYKVYPSIGVEEGLAYAINTFLNYFLLIIGLLVTLRAVGLDLRVLMVLAGGIGIGIGLGLQNMAANFLSSFILIFGRRIKRGDWIKVENTLGRVNEVSLSATKLWNRDNVEYLIPNSNLTSQTIINYSLSDPLIRVHIPVGVSYSSNTEEVTRIMLEAAGKNTSISKQRQPRVWFTEYGNSSLNFELLVWIDIRQISEKEAQSELYYTIFKAFAEAGIVIPFPQRDLHLRSSFTMPETEPDK